MCYLQLLNCFWLELAKISKKTEKSKKKQPKGSKKALQDSKGA